MNKRRKQKVIQDDCGMNGLVYPCFDLAFQITHKLSAVEWFKSLWIFLLNAKSEKEIRTASGYAIDFFILGKWSIVIIAIAHKWDSALTVILVSYLLLTNFLTYARYHFWQRDFRPMSPQRERRRFVSVVLAYFFSGICFAYFYAIIIPTDFTWPKGMNATTVALLYGGLPVPSLYEVTPTTDLAYGLWAAQAAMAGFFVLVLIGNSIPKIKD